MRTLRQWLLVALFALAMAWVEAAAVMYLRLPADRVQPYQANPLPTLPALGPIELVREVATLVMLASVAALAGRDRVARFGFFLIAFGCWDLGYYAFLRWMGGWPTSLLDWDVLFLLPLPWWGPVLAPVSISLLMLTLGTLLTHPRSNRLGRDLSPLAWTGAACGALCAIGIFVWDAARVLPDGIQAVLNVLPQQFLWPQFLAALSLMTIPLVVLGWRLISPAHSPELHAADAPPSPAPSRRPRGGER